MPFVKIAAALALAAAVPAARADASRLDAAGAADAARSWILRSPARHRVPTGRVRTFSVGGTNAFHLVGLSGGGFAALGAAAPQTRVLGFSTHGTLPDADDGSPLWDAIAGAALRRSPPARRAKTGGRAARARFEVAAADVRVPRDRAADPAGSVEDASLLDEVRVPPLLDSAWGQGDVDSSPCYNLFTPSNRPCGCVATAMAQTMRFFALPASSAASSAARTERECLVDGVSTTLTTSGGPYSWQSMPARPSQVALSDAQRSAIGLLCLDAGISVGMDYGTDVSMAFTEFAHAPLVEVFGYAGAHSMFCVDAYVPVDVRSLENSLLASLDAGSPCIVGLLGHSVVCDGYGYSDGALYCHFECGWSGESDFWFLAPESGLESGRVGFDIYSVVYNIFGDFDSQTVSGRVLDSAGDPVPGARVVYTVSDAAGAVAEGSVSASQSGVFAARIPSSLAGRVFACRAEDSGWMSGTVFLQTAACESIVPDDYVSDDFLCHGENASANSWGNDLVLRFAAGVAAAFSDATVLMTEDEARYLSSLGRYETVTNAIASVASSERDAARLLNLDITSPGWRSWRFDVSAISTAPAGGGTRVSLDVLLDRGGRSAPVNGTLALVAVDPSSGAEAVVPGVSFDNRSFASGDVAGATFISPAGSLVVKAVLLPQ